MLPHPSTSRSTPTGPDGTASAVLRRLRLPPVRPTTLDQRIGEALAKERQVSGRADLPWEESVRLDLYYVDNWSPALDLLILWKTVFAVVRRHGAY